RSEARQLMWRVRSPGSRRDVVAERELGPRRSRQVSNRLDIRVYRYRLWLRLERFVHGQPGAIPKSQVYGAEIETAARRAQQHETPIGILCGIDIEHNAVTAIVDLYHRWNCDKYFNDRERLVAGNGNRHQ